jgi:hypothetical protein
LLSVRAAAAFWVLSAVTRRTSVCAVAMETLAAKTTTHAAATNPLAEIDDGRRTMDGLIDD